jgi:phage shock protein PspC (stress-responsive transcriptional regulator)
MKNYKRMEQNKMLSGVLSGLAYSFGFKTWLVRLVFMLAVFTAITLPFLVLVYALATFFAPVYDQDPEDYKQVCE